MKLMILFVFSAACVLSIGYSSDFLSLQNQETQRKFRIFLNEIVRSRSISTSYYLNSLQQTVQRLYNKEEFCDVNGPGKRSAVKPTSVHQLRPGDIDIIGAMGDSLTAANGAFATNLLQAVTEDRSVSWSGGGNGNWQTFITLPNLIKVYNPRLIGYSHSSSGNSYSFEETAKFNVAEPSTLVIDAPRQAKLLVSRMRSDKRVDIKRDWKLITIMTGSNDYCLDACKNTSVSSFIGEAQKNLISALRILQKNLPRTLINLVIPADPILIVQLTNPPLECKLFHQSECPCYADKKYTPVLKRTVSVTKQFAKMVKRVAHMQEFHSNDFEVNLIKFTSSMDTTGPNGKTDYTFMSKDCFHMSQKGHHIFAINLWNSMLTMEDERPEFTEIFNAKFKCPSARYPYFRTSGN